MNDIEALLKEAAKLKKAFDAAAAKAAIAEKAYNAKRDEILGAMNESALDSARSGTVSATITTVDVADVENWDAFYNWMVRKKAYDALQRRPAIKALMDRREGETGKKIPGVEFNKVRRLRLTIR